MNLDLAYTLLSIFSILFIGTIVYINNRKSVTNMLFSLMCLSTIFWAIANYFSLHTVGDAQLYSIRLVLFFAAPYSIFLLIFVNNFPDTNLSMKKKSFISLIFAMVITMVATVSPYVFTGLEQGNTGAIPKPGSLILLFAVTVFGSLLFSIIAIIRKYMRAENLEKRQWRFMLIGTSLSYALLVITNFALVVYLKNTFFIIFGPLFMLPTFIGMAYAIMRYKILNAKAIVVEFLLYTILLISLFEAFIAKSYFELVFRMTLFTAFLVLGIFLIKSIVKEVSLREQLAESNAGQKNLIHIMNHQIKGYPGKDKNIFAELMTDDYGVMPAEAAAIIKEGFNQSEAGVEYVMSILNGNSAESGALNYEMTDLNFKDMVTDSVNKKIETAEKKGLKLELKIEEGKYEINADQHQLSEAIRNLIDNSIYYTPTGSVTVNLKNKDGKILLTIKDTGVGIKESDKSRLFKSGGVGKDSIKVNVQSSGYGLVFSKSVIEYHKGKVWFESEGEGKGTTFFVELPIK